MEQKRGGLGGTESPQLLSFILQQSKRFVPGSLVGSKDIDFVGRSEAETP